MARRALPIDEKISRQKLVVSKYKEKYDAAVVELEKLMKEREALEGKVLLQAYARSKKSLEDVIKFLEVEDANFGEEE